MSNLFSNLTTTQWAFLAAAILFGFIQIYYHFYYFLRLYKFKSSEPIVEEGKGVSVIICARNERENLRKNLPLIFDQNYPNFEVVVVNDASWDGTIDVLYEFAELHPNLKIVEIKEEIKKGEGKKFALTLGIKAAKNPILLLTDADCAPTSVDWIQWMVAPYKNPQIELVLGYSPYETKNNFLNFLIRSETSLTAMNYFSFALANKPYMGVGRNLSYTKDLFFKHKGFASHHHVPFGDDDLFVRDVATPNNTAVVMAPKARMISSPKNSFVKWIRQKQRHLFVGKLYHSNIKKSLGLFALSHFLFWAAAISTILFIQPWWIGGVIILTKWILQWPVIFIAFKKLGYKSLPLFMPFMDIAYLFYSLFGATVYLFSKKPKW
jgi:poly-beta-1,6-N-acetyl-D-glucosamine synthase